MFWEKIKKKLNLFQKTENSELILSENARLKLEKLLGFKIEDETYFIKALTHRSVLESASADLKSNERLEFLGDSVLGQITAEFLFKKFNDEDEGFLTKTRSHLVNTNSLVESADRMNLSELVFIEQKFKQRAGDGIRKISADCLEAIIGAIYLTHGLPQAKKFVEKWILLPNFKTGNYQVDKNFKGQLLELTHIRKLKMPNYRIKAEEGPEHEKTFIVEVLIDKDVYGVGEGKNKKAAEQEAAKLAIENLTEEENSEE